MDPRLRADEALAQARTRGAFVVTPDNATSPMDAAETVRLPRAVLAGDQDAEAPTSPYGWPAPDQSQELPPNPYDAYRRPEEFGPLGSQAANNNTPNWPQ